MPKILVASSPVEIDAKADELELPKEACEVARGMFHGLTDRLGQAVIALEVQHKDWPEHRFFFGTAGREMSALLDGLRAQPAVLDVTHGVGTRQPNLAGLYIQERQGSFLGVLVGHQTHEGFELPS